MNVAVSHQPRCAPHLEQSICLDVAPNSFQTRVNLQQRTRRRASPALLHGTPSCLHLQQPPSLCWKSLSPRPHHNVAVASQKQQQQQQLQQQEQSVQANSAAALPPPPDMQGQNPRAILNAAALAFLGDSVWEVLLRSHVMGAFPAARPSSLLRPSPEGARHSTPPANFSSQAPKAFQNSQHKPLSGRDLTIAARTKANATQQAEYFDYLWGGSPVQQQVSAMTERHAYAKNRGSGGGDNSSSNGGGKGFGISRTRAAGGPANRAGVPQGSSNSSVPISDASSGDLEGNSAVPQQLQAEMPSIALGPARSSVLDGNAQCAPLPQQDSTPHKGDRTPNKADSMPQGGGFAKAVRGTAQGASCTGSQEASTPNVAQEPLLTEDERDVLRWGRNSSAVSPPKGVDSKVYKKATALEVLVAYLYLTDTRRCTNLVHHLLSLPLPINWARD